MSKPDGGHAFPKAADFSPDYERGMSYRRWLAGMAACGAGMRLGQYVGNIYFHTVAENCWRLADAILEKESEDDN